MILLPSTHVFMATKTLLSTANRYKYTLLWRFPLCKCSSVATFQSNPKVTHERHKRCFTVSLEEQGVAEKAVLCYEFTGERRVNLLKTRVPVEARGRGIAAHLAKAAMDFVVEENLKAQLSCWYIKTFVEQNPLPKYRDHIID